MQYENCKLSENVHNQKYQLIIADYLSDTSSISNNPRVVMLGGQPGSGKTKMRELAEKEIYSVVINADDLRDFHPMYRKLKFSNPEKASYLVNYDVSIWTKKLIEQSVRERRNIVFDFTFGTSNQEMLREMLTMFRKNGYEMQLWILAVPAQFSKLGVYMRNEWQIRQTGLGRFVSMEAHDINYRNISANLQMVVENALVDRICIFSRLVELVEGKFVNNQVTRVYAFSKTDLDFADAAELFQKLRNEPLTTELNDYFSFRLKQIVSMTNKRLNEALEAGDAEKAKYISEYKNQLLTIDSK